MKMMVSVPSENDGRSFVPVSIESLLGQAPAVPGQYVQRSQFPSGFSESFDPSWVAPEYVPSPVMVESPAPARVRIPVITADDFRRRQRYAESGFNDRAVSKAGAKGAYQIMPSVLNDYVAATGKKGDLFDYDYNQAVRDWYVDWLMNRPVVNGNGNTQSDVNTWAKMAAAYNWGVGNLTKYLQRLKDKGEDIYNSTDWIEGLNPETRDYVKFIALQQDTTGPRTTEAFNKAMAKYNLASDGGRIRTLADKLIEKGYYSDGVKIRINRFDNGGDTENSEHVLKKYAGTVNDPMYFWDRIANTEAEARNFLLKRNIRESAESPKVEEYFNSYADSPGFARIRQNQKEWWLKRHPYKKIYELGAGKAMVSTDWLQRALRGLDATGTFDYDGYTESSKLMNSVTQPKGVIFIGTKETEEFPYIFAVPHEVAHIPNGTGFATSYGSAQREALDQNTNTEPGHDSEPDEKHSDIEALRYMLYREGIYDSRDDKDATPEDMKKLRELYPNIRPFLQMDDEKAAWMINHVADNNSSVDMSNVAADGGRIRTLAKKLMESGYYADGGKIHIDPSKRGTFKAQATKMGMGVKEAAHHILAHKDNYSSAMVKKANFAANFADEGGTLLRPYNKFEMGGPEGDGKKSQYEVGLEKYLASQADAKRLAAHEKSLNRTLPSTPILRYEELVDSITSEKKRVPVYGPSCIYTALDNYGNAYKVAGNEEFMSNPGKYGFQVIPLTELLPGDIVQSGGISYEGDYVPTHGMIFDGYDDEGYPLFNYSNGTADPEDSGGIRKHKRYPVYTEAGPDYSISDLYNRAYRFVGTPEDQARWKGEYKNTNGVHNTPLGSVLVPPSMLLEVPHMGLVQK